MARFKLIVGMIFLQYLIERIHYYLWHYFDEPIVEEVVKSVYKGDRCTGTYTHYGRKPYKDDYPVWGTLEKIGLFLNRNGHNLPGALLAKYVWIPCFRRYYGVSDFKEEHFRKVLNETVRILRKRYFDDGHKYFKKAKSFL